MRGDLSGFRICDVRVVSVKTISPQLRRAKARKTASNDFICVSEPLLCLLLNPFMCLVSNWDIGVRNEASPQARGEEQEMYE